MASSKLSLCDIGNLVRTLKILDVTNDVSSLGRKLGEGKFGTVYEAEWTYSSKDTQQATPMAVAVKVLDGALVKAKQWPTQTVWKSFVHEFVCWRKIMPHDNVLPVIGVYIHKSTSLPGLVAPYVSEANFKDWLSLHSRGMSGQCICQLVIDIAEGLEHLHSPVVNIVHGDLHMGNIFLHDGRAIITDFGLSKIADTSTTLIHQNLRGDLAVYANVPELSKPDAPRTKQTDIFMFGVIAESIIGSQFNDEKEKQYFVTELQYLSTYCFAREPLERQSAAKIVQDFKEFQASRPEDPPILSSPDADSEEILELIQNNPFAIPI